MSQLTHQVVDGVRVITEGPPPVRDVTDPPAIPTRFTPAPANARGSEPQVETADEVEIEVRARPVVEDEREDEAEVAVTAPMLEREVTPDTLVEASLDDWDGAQLEEISRAALPATWIAAGVAAVAVALAAVGALALW